MCTPGVSSHTSLGKLLLVLATATLATFLVFPAGKQESLPVSGTGDVGGENDRIDYPWWGGQYRPGNVVVQAGASPGQLSGFGLRSWLGVEVLAGRAGGGDRLPAAFGVEAMLDIDFASMTGETTAATGVSLQGVLHFGLRGVAANATASRDIVGMLDPYIKAGMAIRFGIDEYMPDIVNLAFGAGLNLFLHDHVAVGLGYEHVGNFDEHSFDGVAIGARVKIGQPGRLWPKEYWQVLKIDTEEAAAAVARIDRFYRQAFAPAGIRPSSRELNMGEQVTWEIRHAGYAEPASNPAEIAVVTIAFPKQSRGPAMWRRVVITDRRGMDDVYELLLDDSNRFIKLRCRLVPEGPVQEWTAGTSIEWPAPIRLLEIREYLPYVTERTMNWHITGAYQADSVSIDGTEFDQSLTPAAGKWIVSGAIPGGLLYAWGQDTSGCYFECTLLSVESCGGSELRSF